MARQMRHRSPLLTADRHPCAHAYQPAETDHRASRVHCGVFFVTKSVTLSALDPVTLGRIMAANSRLTIAVHALAWLALAQRGGRQQLTSDQVAASVNTNPVIIRRSLGELRRAGLVSVRRGANPGW